MFWSTILLLLVVAVSYGQLASDSAPTSSTAEMPATKEEQTINPSVKDGKTPDENRTGNGNITISSFTQAKEHLREIYRKATMTDSLILPLTFYCGCRFYDKTIDAASCGYKARRPKTKKGKINERARRVEWEHVVPAHTFGGNLKAWRTKELYPECKRLSRRKCAALIHAEFNAMDGDLYNIKPAIGEINGDRANYRMGIISGAKRLYGDCDIKIEKGVIEPRLEIRGDIARIYFYMDWAYPNARILSASERKLFSAWDKADPPSPEEISRAQAVRAIQGNCNPFLLKC